MTVAAFFVLTFAVSWACFFGSAAVAPPGSSPASGIAGSIYLIGVFSPAIVAAALTVRGAGSSGLAGLAKAAIRAPSSARWYCFALGYMAVVKLAAAVVHRVLLGAWPPFSDTPWYLMALAIPFSTPVQIGEELGWRGYALPRLATRVGLGPASVVLGVIWGVWHLPFFLIAGVDKTGQSLPVYVLGTTAMSVAMAWLFWRTGGSLLMTMLMHAAINNTEIVPTALPGASNPWSLHAQPIAWLTLAMMWTVAGWCLVRMRGISVLRVPAAPDDFKNAVARRV
jgi:hypothetical protein